MEKLDKFKKLKALGLPKEEIMQMLGIESRMYYYYNAESEKDKRKRIIDIKAYCDAIISSIQGRSFGTKDDLARMLNVTKPTLTEFEKRSGLSRLFCRFFHIHGKTKKELSKGLSISHESIAEYISDTPTVQEIINSLETALSVYQEMEEYDSNLSVKIYKIKKAVKELKSI